MKPSLPKDIISLPTTELTPDITRSRDIFNDARRAFSSFNFQGDLLGVSTFLGIAFRVPQQLRARGTQEGSASLQSQAPAAASVEHT